MAEHPENLNTVLKRPIDFSKQLMDIFFEMMEENGEIPIDDLLAGVPGAEMFFFCGTPSTVMGVNVLRYANAKTHRQLFEKAGVLHMYNPYSVQSCWLHVRPQYRGRGVARQLKGMRNGYLQDRPCHEIARADRVLAAADGDFSQAGHNFTLSDDGPELRLLVHNHDQVLDTSKRLVYC